MPLELISRLHLICLSTDSKFPYVRTVWYEASGYTVTGVNCVPSPPLTAVYVPQKNLLDPPKFSAEIAAFNKGGSSLSVGAKAGIGVGVGLAAAALIVSMLFGIRRRRLRRSGAKSVPEQNTDAAELPGKSNAHELGSKFWDSPELPSHENPKEMSVGEIQELPGHWLPPEASMTRQDQEL